MDKHFDCAPGIQWTETADRLINSHKGVYYSFLAKMLLGECTASRLCDSLLNGAVIKNKNVFQAALKNDPGIGNSDYIKEQEKIRVIGCGSAVAYGHKTAGTEHLLLGFLRLAIASPGNRIYDALKSVIKESASMRSSGQHVARAASFMAELGNAQSGIGAGKEMSLEKLAGQVESFLENPFYPYSPEKHSQIRNLIKGDNPFAYSQYIIWFVIKNVVKDTRTLED